MAHEAVFLLQQPTVRAALAQAWKDSVPGLAGGHEEGGFILQNESGDVSVSRWRIGLQNSIVLPTHSDCNIGGYDILGSFHTHPNTGPDYLQEPSDTDRRSIRDDPDLKGPLYKGEFVMSQRRIYLIETNGQVSDLAETPEILRDL